MYASIIVRHYDAIGIGESRFIKNVGYFMISVIFSLDHLLGQDDAYNVLLWNPTEGRLIPGIETSCRDEI